MVILPSMHKHLILLLFILPGCGWIHLGVAPTGTDPPPTGDVIASGTLQTVNASVHPGKEVSGLVMIYRDTSSGQHIVRLDSLSAPNEPGTLSVVVVAGGETVLNSSLRSAQGNQNYVTTVSSTDLRTWSSVSIRSTNWSDPTTADYGKALLIPTN